MKAPGAYSIERVRIQRDIDSINTHLAALRRQVEVMTYQRNRLLATGHTTFRRDRLISEKYDEIHAAEQLRRRMFADLSMADYACGHRRQAIVARAHERAIQLNEKSR